MSWQDLLAEENKKILPWLGGKKVYGFGQVYRLEGRRPNQFGWYVFVLGGRKARLQGPAEGPGPDFEEQHPLERGYLAGSRFIQDEARVDPDPECLVDQTEQVYLVERGLERFTRAVVARTEDDKLVYLRQELPLGPEFEVQAAFQDRKSSVDHVQGVTPALDLTFLWETRQRELQEEREQEIERLRLEEERKREAEERRRQAERDAGTGIGRRTLARWDFKAAAQAALAVSGAELLDFRESIHPNEMVVQYRVLDRRLECVCHRDTLRIIDAGVCLSDHRGNTGDTRFTLESLPSVIKEALIGGKLVVWRHVPGDPDW